MMKESVKKSLEKWKNVLEKKRKMVKQKICIKKTYKFILIAMNCVQEQLINSILHFGLNFYLLYSKYHQVQLFQ